MRLRTVVIGIDFTAASMRAVRWVASSIAPDAELVLVHVIPGPRLPSYVRSSIPTVGDFAVTGASALRSCLRGIAESTSPGRVRVDLLSGAPAEALAFVADECGADLICVGRGSRRQGSARFGATMPHRLLTWTRVPVLVGPNANPGAPSRLIAGVDERPGGDVVFSVACTWASAFAARLDAVHVVEAELEAFAVAARRFAEETELVTSGQEVPLHPERQPDATWLRDRASSWVDARLLDACTNPGAVRSIVCSGDPGQELIRHAQLNRASLIILGRGGDRSHAEVPVGSLKVGSTTRLVLWAATCPVLVLPTDARRAPPNTPPRGRRERARLLEFPPGPGVRSGANGTNEKIEPPLPAARFDDGRCA